MANGGKTAARKLVAELGEIEHGTSKKFTLRRGQRTLEALLVNFDGRYFAYINRCPHTGITLDWVNNQFFSSDQRYLMCATHGAVFEPPTGEQPVHLKATAALPGTAEKLDVLAERLRQGLPLWHPADRMSYDDNADD